MEKAAYQEEDESSGTQLAVEQKTYGPVNFDHFDNRNDKVAMFKMK